MYVKCRKLRLPQVPAAHSRPETFKSPNQPPPGPGAPAPPAEEPSRGPAVLLRGSRWRSVLLLAGEMRWLQMLQSMLPPLVFVPLWLEVLPLQDAQNTWP